MIEIQPPFSAPNNSYKNIFLAGSIEMNAAEHWQKTILTYFKFKNANFFNPRRDDWDSSIEQCCENDKFREQVNWEISNILDCDLVVFYIDQSTKSPITLMEIGLVAGKGKNAIVCCPNGYWRKGNVNVICDRFQIPQVENLSRLIAYIDTYLTT